MRISKEWRVTWTFSYTYFEGKESYFDILLYVFRRDGELLGHYPMRVLKKIVHLLCQFHAGNVGFSAVCQALYR
jgi:hypothetical protein